MSPFMSSMPAAGLIEMPPVSNTTPLPMKASGLARFDLAPCHCMMATRAGRTLPCATDSSVLIFSSVSASTSRISTSSPIRLELLDAIGELDRAQHVGGLVDEIAGEVDADGESALGLECGARLVGVGAVNDEPLKAVLRGRAVAVSLFGFVGRLLLGEVFLELVVTQQSAVSQARRDEVGFAFAGGSTMKLACDVLRAVTCPSA